MLALQADEDVLFGTILIVQIVFYLAFAIVCAAIAPSRGRSAVGWFFIGLLFQCFALVLLLVMPDLKKQEEERRRQEMENRRLREQIAKERQVADSRQTTVDRRLGAHDQALGIDTANAPLLDGGTAAHADPAAAAALPPPLPTTAEWYYARGNQRLGPVQLETMRHLFAAGAIDRATLVWRQGMADWQKLDDLPELRGGNA